MSQGPSHHAAAEPRASRTISGPPPFLLVRVQSRLHHATVDAAGLRLPYVRQSEFGRYRNTMHWTVNTLVADHAYGRFNERADGSFKGRVVILADPRELPTPAGLGQVDTWYRMDATRGDDGGLDRGLHVGRHAVVVAPEDEPVPDGVRVVRYAGGIEARDAAVHAVLREQGIAPAVASMWGWAGSDATQWAKDTITAHYPDDASRIHTGAHDASLDNRIEEGIRIDDMVGRFRTERLHTGPGGVELPIIDTIRARIEAQRTVLQTVLDSLSAEEVVRTGQFYTGHLDALDRLAREADRIAREWEAKLDAPAPAMPLAFTAPPADLRAKLPPLPPGAVAAPAAATRPFGLPVPSPFGGLRALQQLPPPVPQAPPGVALPSARKPAIDPAIPPGTAAPRPLDMDELLIALDQAGEATTSEAADRYMALLAGKPLDATKPRAEAVHAAVHEAVNKHHDARRLAPPAEPNTAAPARTVSASPDAPMP
ncbi:hypothetical protein [Cupriavidus sp. TMH.W2]|uniref:hypothetical protein n=1 Tax=Cupriavidus sp. TMH.W2 TaxID=3434465 RepID=UPI003D781933